MANFFEKLSHAYNAFTGRGSEDQQYSQAYGTSSSSRPDRIRLHVSNEKSIVSSLYTRLGIDVAAITIEHVRLDDNKRYLETINSGLNDCLNTEANIDQAARAFKQDLAMTLFDKGALAIVPIDTDFDPASQGSVNIKTLRIGEITSWYPRHVRVLVYNDVKGRKEELTLPKSTIAIVENPLFSVMNEPSSTLQRLTRKLNLLDSIDDAAGSGKLDMIIQLPYVIKTESRREQAKKRADDIKDQLRNSDYGIAYTDGTEKITQLNRPVENNLLKQIEYLTSMLYGQLGVSQAVFDGTASEEEMLNYYNRTIEPILASLAEAMKRSFLTKTARTQMQSIEYFRDPFKLVPVGKVAEIADVLLRNEVASSNEIRGILGWKPSKDPKADQLINSNMPGGGEAVPVEPEVDTAAEDADMQDDALSEVEKALDGVFAELGMDVNA